MGKLNQVIAAEKGVKQRSHTTVTQAYHTLQKPALFHGQERVYQPHEDGATVYPPESQRVQTHVADVLNDAKAALTELFDVTATKDWANQTARASVVVDGKKLLTDVPATFLLFLEKQLVDLRTLLSTIPVHDPAEEWSKDSNTGLYKSGTAKTFKTQKVMRNHVLSEATKEHPAQVQAYTEDVPIGTWNTVKFTSGFPATDVRALTARVDTLAAAVKHAREEANLTEAPAQKVGDVLLSYIIG